MKSTIALTATNLANARSSEAANRMNSRDPKPIPPQSADEHRFPQRWKAGRTWLALGVAALVMVLHLSASAYTVTTLADSGPGSLRAGIASGGNIDFNVTGTITLTSGEILINHEVSISGPGASQLTISGNNASRVFNITSGSISVRISDVTVANGLAAGGAGGGISCSSGGGFYFTRLVVTGNTAGNNGGGLHITGSGGYILNCTISGNTAGHDGGGLLESTSGGYLIDSTVSGNSAGHDGGGVHVSGSGGYLTYSTISGNSAAGNGGGLYYSGQVAYLEHLTITQNVADQDSDGTGNGGGVYFLNVSASYVYDNIIAENFDTPNNAGPGQKHRDFSGTFDFGDYNLIQDTTGWPMRDLITSPDKARCLAR